MAEAFPSLPPAEAIEFFRSKGLARSFAWQDVFQEEHARVFTVAKGMSRAVLEAIREAVDQALAEGKTLEQFIAELRPRLEELGWWGKSTMIDPLTGTPEAVQLGSPRRLQTIYRVNLRSAYSAGKWQRIEAAKREFPFLRYVQIKRPTEREEHRAWHGTILPVDHPFWDQHFPPCDWNCACTVQQLNQRQLERRGWTVADKPPPSNRPRTYTNPRTGEQATIEAGIAPGFGFNIGKAYLAGLMPRPLPEGPAPIAGSWEATPAITAFLDVFGLDPDQEAVWTDPDGWPLAIGAGLFRDATGTLAPTAEPGALQLAARALRSPIEIRWVWRAGADGRPLLFRRYLSALKALDGNVGVVVDMSSVGWAFATSRRDAGFDMAKLRTGDLAWTALWPVDAARRSKGGGPRFAAGRRPGFDPAQARDAGGRWKFTGASKRSIAQHARQSLGEKGTHRVLDLGPVRNEAAVRQAVGVDIAGYGRQMRANEMRHTLKQHGDAGVEAARIPPQLAVKPSDFERIPAITTSAYRIELQAAVAGRRPARLRYSANVAGVEYRYVETVHPRTKTVALLTLWKFA